MRPARILKVPSPSVYLTLSFSLYLSFSLTHFRCLSFSRALARLREREKKEKKISRSLFLSRVHRHVGDFPTVQSPTHWQRGSKPQFLNQRSHAEGSGLARPARGQVARGARHDLRTRHVRRDCPRRKGLALTNWFPFLGANLEFCGMFAVAVLGGRVFILRLYYSQA